MFKIVRMSPPTTTTRQTRTLLPPSSRPRLPQLLEIAEFKELKYQRSRLEYWHDRAATIPPLEMKAAGGVGQCRPGRSNIGQERDEREARTGGRNGENVAGLPSLQPRLEVGGRLGALGVGQVRHRSLMVDHLVVDPLWASKQREKKQRDKWTQEEKHIFQTKVNKKKNFSKISSFLPNKVRRVLLQVEDECRLQFQEGFQEGSQEGFDQDQHYC